VPKEKQDWPGTAYEVVVGAAAGGFTGGPLGAAVGGGGPAIKKIIDLVRQDRFSGGALARLQEDRLAEAIKEAARTIEYMEMLGHEPRKDWFAQEGDNLKSSVSGVELLEGTLIAAANEFERRKVKLIANLWSQLAFNPTVGFDAGVFLLKLVNELSYHELALVATVTELAGPPPTASDAELDLAVAAGPVVSPNTGHDSKDPFTGSSTTAMQVYDLIRRDVIRQDKGNEVPSNTRQIRPWRCTPTLVGRRLYVLSAMRTHIRIEEKTRLANELVPHSGAAAHSAKRST
jgi:hypothetical protein